MNFKKHLKIFCLSAASGFLAYKYLKHKPCKAFPVSDLDLLLLLGDWNEIARTDMAAEQGLIDTTFTFDLLDPTTLSLTLKGFDSNTGRISFVEHTAKVRRDGYINTLRLSGGSGFGLNGRTIVAIDRTHQHLLMFGNNIREAWVLSKQDQVPQQVIDRFMGVAEYIGAKPEKFIWIPRHIKNLRIEEA